MMGYWKYCPTCEVPLDAPSWKEILIGGDCIICSQCEGHIGLERIDRECAFDELEEYLKTLQQSIFSLEEIINNGKT